MKPLHISSPLIGVLFAFFLLLSKPAAAAPEEERLACVYRLTIIYFDANEKAYERKILIYNHWVSEYANGVFLRKKYVDWMEEPFYGTRSELIDGLQETLQAAKQEFEARSHVPMPNSNPSHHAHRIHILGEAIKPPVNHPLIPTASCNFGGQRTAYPNVSDG